MRHLQTGHSCRSSPSAHHQPLQNVTPSVDADFSIVDFDLIDNRAQVYAKETNREGGKPFLYSHFDWPFEVVE